MSRHKRVFTTYCIRRAVLWLIVLALALSACAPEVVKYNETGNAKFEKGDYEKAIKDYQEAQGAEQDAPEPYYNAANAYNRQGQLEDVVAQTEEMRDTDDPELRAQAQYNLGNAYFDAQQWQQAVEAYQKALRENPNDSDAKHNLELALQHVQEQEQQQQASNSENQDSDSQDSEKQQGEQEQSGEQQPDEAQAQPTPESESDQSEEQAASQSSEQSSEEQAPSTAEPQEMTEGQAVQLLRALLDNETLQEKLREIYQVPGPAPEEDW